MSNFNNQTQQKMAYNPFAYSYLYNNYNQSMDAIKSTNLPIQQGNQALSQLQLQHEQQMREQIENSGVLYQHHMLTHPQVVDMVHKETPIQVIQRGQFESIWKNKCTQLEQALREVQNDLNRLRGIGITEKVTYVEDSVKTNQLYVEIDRLNKCLLDMSLELDQSKQQIKQIQTRQGHNQLQSEIQRLQNLMLENDQYLNAEIKKLRDSNEDWQKRYSLLEDALAEARSSEGTIRELEIKVGALRRELDRGTLQLTQKQAECDDYRQKYMRCEAVLKNQDVTELEIKRLKDMLDARNMEIENLRLATGEAKEWEVRAQGLQNEIDRLKGVIKQKDDEIKNMKFENARASLLKEMEQKCQRLQGENNDLINELNKVSNREKALSQEYDKLKDEYDQLMDKYQEMAENGGQQVTQQITILQSEMEIWKQKYTEANRELHKTQEELIMKAAEYESLQKELLSKKK